MFEIKMTSTHDLQATLQTLRAERGAAEKRIDALRKDNVRRNTELERRHRVLIKLAEQVDELSYRRRSTNELLTILNSGKLPVSVSRAELKVLRDELATLRTRLVQERGRYLTLLNTLDSLLGTRRVYAVLSSEQLSMPTSNTSVRIDDTSVTITLPSSGGALKGLSPSSTTAFDITGAISFSGVTKILANLPLRNYIYKGENLLFLGTGTPLAAHAIFGSEGSLQGSVLDAVLTQLFGSSTVEEKDFILMQKQELGTKVEPVLHDAERELYNTPHDFAVKVMALGFCDTGLTDLLDTSNTSIAIAGLRDFSTLELEMLDDAPSIPWLIGCTKLIATGESYARSIVESILADICLELETIMLVLEVSFASRVVTIGFCQAYSSEAVRQYASGEHTDECDPLNRVFADTLGTVFGSSETANIILFAGLDADSPPRCAETLTAVSSIQKSRTIAVRELL
ncbi:hypothetical protein GMRT_11844 [Giardia muris]|uniref:Uncharacterized protein n=1 Tax=Giardia muris TaxID=5742 RepID=A0A4Z1SSS6_GIAMU|nr:hypothetical protein GMRT_11844 [Giardia muris]|eukprot:TNJ28982.1 hypothetical protein GMRT_11844 [Giardia muris]